MYIMSLCKTASSTHRVTIKAACCVIIENMKTPTLLTSANLVGALQSCLTSAAKNNCRVPFSTRKESRRRVEEPHVTVKGSPAVTDQIKNIAQWWRYLPVCSMVHEMEIAIHAKVARSYNENPGVILRQKASQWRKNVVPVR